MQKFIIARTRHGLNNNLENLKLYIKFVLLGLNRFVLSNGADERT